MRQKQSKSADQRDNPLIVKLSDGYTTDDITYQWDSDDPLQLSNNLDLPRFAVFTCLILTKIWTVLMLWIISRHQVQHWALLKQLLQCENQHRYYKDLKQKWMDCQFCLSGEYSCLSVDLVFKRQFSYYLITIYVPGCMLVIVSWVCLCTFYKMMSAVSNES